MLAAVAAPGTHEVDPTVEEVRVALALNGGVSLAVWMGGCAVELDRARLTRHRGGAGTVYRALCDAFRRERAFDDLCRGANVAAPLIPALDITTTDIGGRPLKFADTWRQQLLAREYRARFRFRRADDFKPHALAHAARASASFPLAFEPYAVPYDAAPLAGLDGGTPLRGSGGLGN